MINPQKVLRQFTLTAAATVLCAGAALAASAASEAQARYRQEMADCNQMTSKPAMVTCKKEANNALAEAKRGRLTSAPADQYQQNALQRCNAHQGDDRTACEARMGAEGKVEGSVESGGVLRESETLIPAQ